MFSTVFSNSTSVSEEASAGVSSGTRVQDFVSLNPMVEAISTQQPQKIKKRRNLPGNPDPDAEVISLSPRALLTTNRFVCEVCNKGFQRDQNLQLHRRGHNLPWKLKQRNSNEINRKKKVYVCPEPTCVHHHPSRALGDLTGVKKHYCRKHGEKKWKCEKCSKVYAVLSDWKAHAKTCGTREYKCECGILFNRRDSFINHRAFCDALAEETARLSSKSTLANPIILYPQNLPFTFPQHHHHHLNNNTYATPDQNPNLNPNRVANIKPEPIHKPMSSSLAATHKNFITTSAYDEGLNINVVSSAHLSATALLQKAAALGAHCGGHERSTMAHFDVGGAPSSYLNFRWKKSDGLARDFLGLTRGNGHGNGVCFGLNIQGFGFGEPVAASETWGN